MYRSYSDMCSKCKTFEERLRYLQLKARVGQDTFGHLRYLNQRFYQTKEWKSRKQEIIIRDHGCDLGVEGYDIFDRIYIHHINPIDSEDLIEFNPYKLLHPENLICCRDSTHQAIHYGNDLSIMIIPIERKPGDTKLW